MSGGPESALYRHRRDIAFWDCDAAGIVFTGRFPQFCLEAIDGWFRERLGTEWYRLNQEGTGTPFVHMSMDFRSPATPTDVLHTTVALARAGGSSLSFRLFGHVGERLCFEGTYVCTFTNRAHTAPVPIPERYRAAVAREAALAAGAGIVMPAR